MMFTSFLYAILAPSLTCASAFLWITPYPTIFAPAADNWSPLPTAAPPFGRLGLFGRAETKGNNTCGYISALPESPIVCPHSTLVCATHTYDGVHGCCNPSQISSCTIPTTCIPSTALPTLCTDKSCTSNSSILKCTAAAEPECYMYIVVYSKTSMTQHSCAKERGTVTAYRSWGGTSSSTIEQVHKTVTATVTVTSPTLPSSPTSQSTSSPNLGAILGGTIGGCLVLSGVVFALFLVYRKRQARVNQPPISYPATGHGPYTVPTTTYVACEQKVWQQADVRGPMNGSVGWDSGTGREEGGVVVAEIDGRARSEAPG